MSTFGVWVRVCDYAIVYNFEFNYFGWKCFSSLCLKLIQSAENKRFSARNAFVNYLFYINTEIEMDQINGGVDFSKNFKKKIILVL